MEDGCDWRLHSDWYSPTRLHDSPVEYDFPGDRFIPNRSLMDFDQAHSELTNKKNKGRKPKFKIEYRWSLDNLTLNAEGRPFQMLVFRGSPKSSRKPSPLSDEARRSSEEILCRPSRQFPKHASRVLDAPDIMKNFYLNIMDWGKTNILAVGLGTKVYFWNADSSKVDLLSEVRENDYPASVSWSGDGNMLRWLDSHQRRVGSISWNSHLLTSGSSDGAIINHDVRVRDSVVCDIKVHKEEVCGLKWSSTGNFLASGGNDDLVHLWDARKMGAGHYVYRFNHHRAAVKALAWCPYDCNVLASGGGSRDNCIKIWDIQKGTCTRSTDTQAQISGLQWNRHHKEILSSHGYGSKCENRLCLWRYPSMSSIGKSTKHGSRVLHITQSPDGLTVASAGEDSAIRFWEVFGPAAERNSRMSYLDGLLSLKMSPMR